MTIHEAYTQLMYQLFELYDDREAANIADMVIEHITGQRKIDRIINKQMLLSEANKQLLSAYTTQLLNHTPVQYVLHESWFAGMKLYVDKNVLIPRPETEELVEWIIRELDSLQAHSPFNIHHSPFTILDIGTGSGCIPIALKKKINSAKIYAVDISSDALDVAKKNATAQQTDILFYRLNVLNKPDWEQLPRFDIIVSNPPYIRKTEAGQMHENVLKHEPHLALFVPNNDVLLFYTTIASFGLKHLNASGKLFFEINEAFGEEISVLLKQFGYTNIELKKDLQGKDRMIKCLKV